MEKKILPDGSVEGETFSGANYTGGYPYRKHGETMEEYRARVAECKKQGFHLGDLSWSDWHFYCSGDGE